MPRVLSDDDIDAIAQKLISFSGLTNEEHKKQHEAFAIYIATQTRRVAFWEKIREQVGGWAIIGILSFIGYAVWHGFLYLLNRGGQ